MTPTRLAVCGDDLPAVFAATKRAGLQVVRSAPEVVLCHGGDGTLLRAQREWPDVPKLPARVGSRARLCADHGLDAVLAGLTRGTLAAGELPLLSCRVGELHVTALNDVVLRNESPATALRITVRAAGRETGEITGDGIVCATPFGSTGYFRSIARRSFDEGFGLAFSNSTDALEPLLLPRGETVEIVVLRGPAELVRDNDPRSLNLREGSRVRLSLSDRHAVVLGLDALSCQRCRRADGSAFNPH